MVSTRNGVDIINVKNLDEAKNTLSQLYEASCLSKSEIAGLVSFSGLSITDTVKCYNSFVRDERKVVKGEISFTRAA